MEVVDEAGSHLGDVTSGTFSPTLGVGIGLALLDRSVPLGARVGVLVRRRTEEFEVVKPPFVTPSVRQA
jgi:aminomethyltransferase